MDLSWPCPRWYSGKEPTASAGDTRDMGSIPGSGRSPGGGNDNPLQYSCLENSINTWAWWATVHGVAKNQTWLSTHTHLTMKGQENSPAQLGGGADDGSMRSTQERQGSSSCPPPLFLWLQNYSPVSSQDVASLACPFVKLTNILF